MSDDFAIFVTLWLAMAAVFAFHGTNIQAQLSRGRLLDDADPLVAAAGRLWVPNRWVVSRRRRRALTAAEAAVRAEPVRRQRYERLRRELVAWNALESSVALAANRGPGPSEHAL